METCFSFWIKQTLPGPINIFMKLTRLAFQWKFGSVLTKSFVRAEIRTEENIFFLLLISSGKVFMNGEKMRHSSVAESDFLPMIISSFDNEAREKQKKKNKNKKKLDMFHGRLLLKMKKKSWSIEPDSTFLLNIFTFAFRKVERTLT